MSRLGGSRINAAKTARSAHSRGGLGFPRRETATSCRNTSSSAFFGRVERAKQGKPADDTGEDQVEQAQRHEPESPHAPFRSYRRRPEARTDFWHPHRR